MLHLRITTPSDLTDRVVAALSGDPAVSQLAVLAGAAVQPPGDIVLVKGSRAVRLDELAAQLSVAGIDL